MEKAYHIKENLDILFSEENGWFLKGSNGMYDLNNPKHTLYLLPLLEHDYEEFAKATSKYDKNEKSFPLKSLMTFPFENKMDYWAQLSLSWIEKDLNKFNLTEWAQNIDTDWMPQKLKHKFWKTFRLSSYHRA